MVASALPIRLVFCLRPAAPQAGGLDMTFGPSDQFDPAGARGAKLSIVNQALGHGRVTLIEPSSHGYLYIATSTRPGTAPIVLPSGQREKLLLRVKQLCAALAGV